MLGDETQSTRHVAFDLDRADNRIDWKAIKKRLREQVRQFGEFPTCYVMTQRTLAFMRTLKGVGFVDYGEDMMPRCAGGIEAMGIKVEVYLTIEECMDRMVKAEGNDRPVLVVQADEIPTDASHPFMQQQVEALRAKYGF